MRSAALLRREPRKADENTRFAKTCDSLSSFGISLKDLPKLELRSDHLNFGAA